MTVAALPYKCPAAPYEAALLLDDELRRRGLRERSEIDVYSPEPAPMPVAGPAMGAAVVGLLEAKGIRFHPGSRVAAVRARQPRGRPGRRQPRRLRPPRRRPTASRASGGARLLACRRHRLGPGRPRHPRDASRARLRDRRRDDDHAGERQAAAARRRLRPRRGARRRPAGSRRRWPAARPRTRSTASATAGSRPVRDAPRSPSASSSPSRTRRSRFERLGGRGTPARCSSSARGSAAGWNDGWRARASPWAAASSG